MRSPNAERSHRNGRNVTTLRESKLEKKTIPELFVDYVQKYLNQIKKNTQAKSRPETFGVRPQAKKITTNESTTMSDALTHAHTRMRIHTRTIANMHTHTHKREKKTRRK